MDVYFWDAASTETLPLCLKSLKTWTLRTSAGFELLRLWYELTLVVNEKFEQTPIQHLLKVILILESGCGVRLQEIFVRSTCCKPKPGLLESMHITGLNNPRACVVKLTKGSDQKPATFSQPAPFCLLSVWGSIEVPLRLSACLGKMLTHLWSHDGWWMGMVNGWWKGWWSLHVCPLQFLLENQAPDSSFLCVAQASCRAWLLKRD